MGEEVERIHHREVLNQDQREIKYIQEVMLEDGDLHSDNARTRKFRWNGLDDDIELERRPSDDEGDNEAADTLQAEQEKRRLERLDREKWLKRRSKDWTPRLSSPVFRKRRKRRQPNLPPS